MTAKQIDTFARNLTSSGLGGSIHSAERATLDELEKLGWERDDFNGTKWVMFQQPESPYRTFYVYEEKDNDGC